MLGMIMIHGLEEGKKISIYTKRRFIKAMEYRDKKPKQENIIFQSLRTEYIRVKVEGRRDILREDTSVFFAQTYRFEDQKQSQDFKNFKISESRPGQYIMDSWRRWFQRSNSHQLRSRLNKREDRPRSSRSNKDIMAELKKIKVDVTKLKQQVAKVNFVKEEELEVKSVFLTENEKKT